MATKTLSAPPRMRTSPTLRRILAPYPRPVELPDGAMVILRPVVSGDRDKLVALFIDIPHEELRNLQDNVSDPTVVLRWCRNLNYDRVLPIVAELDGKIVGDATLHRRAVGPMRQIGRFRAYVRPEYRNRGIGTVLLQEIMGVARQVGLTQLAVELYEDQTALRKVFSRYGFREEGRIPVYQRVILLRDLAEEQETTGAAGEERAAPGEMTTGTILGRDGPRPRQPGAP
ncbi:MAG TPA: GNAT family N-acetyltransferase [bacterium]|nr:GNAT family N-acetyltransferase [bacterium]